MPYNVLIVDDSKTTRTIIEKSLRSSGVEVGTVHGADDGVEALELLADNWVDIIFADLNMPRMGGLELVERMADLDIVSSVPVVIVSTEGRADRIDALMKKGVAAYVRKPFSPEQLAAVVHSLVESPPLTEAPERLTEAFFEAVEGFAMLVAEPVDHVAQPPATVIAVRMSFESPGVIGEMALVAGEGGCGLVAETATGETALADGCDALRELLNVTCGHFVDSLTGGPFTLSQPEVSQGAGRDLWPAAEAPALVQSFDVEGVPMVLSVHIQPRW